MSSTARRISRLAIGATAMTALTAGLAATSATAAPAPTAATAAACTPAANFVIGAKRTTFRGMPVVYDTLTAGPRCAATRGAGTLAYAIMGNRDAEIAQWKREVSRYPDNRGSYTRHNSVKVNEAGLAVVQAETYFDLGGAHGNRIRNYFIVNTQTGSLVSKAQMLGDMQRLGGPRWNYLREAQWRADRAAGGAVGGPRLTLADLKMYPTRAGMVTSVDHGRYYPAAAGTVQFTIPWSSLIGAGDRVSWLPDRWGY